MLKEGKFKNKEKHVMSRQLLSESVVFVEILHRECPTVLQESPVRVLKEHDYAECCS